VFVLLAPFVGNEEAAGGERIEGSQPIGGSGMVWSEGRRVARWGVVACVLLALGAVAGCGGDSAESDGPSTELRITNDFGHELVWARDDVPLERRGTLLKQLRDEHEVRLYDIAPVVKGIDGVSSRQGQADETTWATMVNGIETDIRAPEYRLYPGDVVQWDLRDWYVTLDVRATVGAFPETFTRGVFGKRFPVRVLCEKPRSEACQRVERVLERAGVDLGAQPKRPRSELPPPGNPQRARVLVGRWVHWRDRKWSKEIDDGARYSGVFARFGRDARSLQLYDWNDERVRTEGASVGLLAATRPTEEDLVWYVTGIDKEGVDRAAKTLDPDSLRDAFAVVITNKGVVKLPLVPGP
jgi:hypothetical protein